MSERLLLLCDAQRMPSHEASPNPEIVLELTWQLAWSEGYIIDNAHRDWALPWKWNTVTNVHLSFRFSEVSLPPAIAITDATNTTPIVITLAAHGLANDTVIKITGVLGNTAANGIWTIVNVTANTFELNNSTGNGTYTLGSGTLQLVSIPLKIPVEANAPLSLSLAERAKAVAALDSAADRLNAIGDSAIAAFTVNPDNPDEMMPEEGHVVQLQSSTCRTTAGLGFALNLSAWIKVPLSSLPSTIWDSATHKLQPNVDLVAMPVLHRGGVTFTPDATGPTFVGTAPSGSRLSWSTTASGGAGTEPTLTASLQAVLVDLNNDPNRYVQRKSGWIRKSLGTGASPFEAPAPGTHWPTTLADRVAEAWDLPRILFDAVRHHASIPAFETYWRMIVAALRDRAGLGYIDTPDGEGLLRYALQLAVPIDANPSSAEKLVRDGQLRSLQARLRAFEMTYYANDLQRAYKDWYAILKTLDRDLPDQNQVVASRRISVEWRTNDGLSLLTAADAAAAPGAPPPLPPTFDVRWHADSVAGPTITFANVTGKLNRSEEGRAVFTFDLYQSAIDKPVPRGWLSVVGTPPASAAIESNRSEVTAGVAEALAPLMRLHTILRNRDGLRRAILPVWEQIFKDINSPPPVPPSTRSCPWFDTIHTILPATPATGAVAEGVGDIRPLDGRFWVVTVPTIGWRPWTIGNKALLEFAPSFNANGSHPTGVETLCLEIEWKSGHQVELRWRRRDSTGTLGAAINPQPHTLSGDNPFDVRVEWSRGGTSGTIAARASARFDGSWHVSSSLPDQASSAGQPGFDRLGLRFINPNSAGPDLLAGAPTLLTAPKSLTDPRPDVQALASAWDALPDPGLALWQQAQQPSNDPSQKKIEAVLRSIDSAELLASSQVARLMPVWNQTQPDFFKSINDLFRSLLSKVFGERFDVPVGARSSSIYRDFWPVVDVSTLPPQVLALIDSQVNFEIEDLPLPTATAASGYDAADEDRVRLPAVHGLHLQVIEPATFETSNYSGFDDDQQHISGFGIVLRQADPSLVGAIQPDDYFADKPWRLLDLVDLGAFDPANPGDPGPYEAYPRLASHAARPAAIPLPYQDNARLTMISYQNRHLMAVSPLSDIAEDADFGNDELNFRADWTVSPTQVAAASSLAVHLNATTYVFNLTVLSDGSLPPHRFGPDSEKLGKLVEELQKGKILSGGGDTLADLRVSARGKAGQLLLTSRIRAFGAATELDTQSSPPLRTNPVPPPFQRQVPSPPSGGGHDWGLLPTLKFGEWYQALMFVLGNAGQLPKELSQAAHPTALRQTPPADVELQSGGVDAAWGHIRRYVYLRRVGVSLPRSFSANPLTQDADLQKNLIFKTPVIKEIPRDVLPLARDWGLRGLSALQAEQRYFYDPESGSGTLHDPKRWEILLPRIFVAGGDEADRPASGTYEFRLTVGLDIRSPGTSCLVDFHRTLDVLDVTVNATTISVNLVSPDGGPLQSGAIDLKIAFRLSSTALGTGDISVAWRRSDRDEPWNDVVAFPGVPAAGDPLHLNDNLSWLTVRRPAAAITTTAAPTPFVETVLTFGAPTFASSSAADVAPVERPLSEDSPAIAILRPDTNRMAPDSVTNAHNAADVLAKWRPSPNELNRNDIMDFWIRLPSVDLDTWNAWIDMDRLIPPVQLAQLTPGVPQFQFDYPRTHAQYKNDYNRSRIWVQHHSRRQQENSSEDQHDVSLDDPAVNLLVVELRPLRVDRPESVRRFAWKPLIDSSIINTWSLMREVQRKLREFQIGVISRIDGFLAAEALSKINGATVTAAQVWSELQLRRMETLNDDVPVTILLQEQEIWELRIYPAVRELYFTAGAAAPGRQRFHPEFTEPVIITHTDASGSERYRLLPPWRVVLEVATSDVVLPARDFVKTATVVITDASNAEPIVITSAAHGLVNDIVIKIVGVLGNTAANGIWIVDKVTANTFALKNSKGSGTYTSGTGSWKIELSSRKQMHELALRKTVLDAVHPSFDGRFVSVDLFKPSPRTFRYASDLRLMRQVWRWTGRPVPPFPFSAAAAGLLDAFPPNLDSALYDLESPEWPMIWDAAGFGDRSSIDLIDEVRLLSAVNASAELFREDLGGDLRSLYYRFSAQAKSRYAPLYPDVNDQGSSEHWKQPDPADLNFNPNQSVEERNAWRRLLVPARRQDELPRPAVRFVIPLTEPEDDRLNTPGLLVVLDDAWYRFGGLAESLDADVVEAADYFNTTGTQDPLMRPEFGPDPILSPYGWTRSAVNELPTDDNPPTKQPLSMQVVGPIGYTFDTNAGAPLYNASSFVLRPPMVNPVTGDDSLAWYFVKVRFRRFLTPEAHTDYRTTLPVALSGTDDTDLVLQADRNWVIDCPNIHITSGAATSFTIVLNDNPALPGGTEIPAGSRGTLQVSDNANQELELSWTPSGVASPTATVKLAAVGWTELAIDLRIVQSLDARITTNNDSSKKPQPRHTAILYRVHKRDSVSAEITGVWHRLVAWGWSSSDPNGHDWPNHIRRQAGGNIIASSPLVFLARLSPFTTPQWIQFLPNSQRLVNLLTNSSRTNRYVLRWESVNGVPQTLSGAIYEITPENEAGTDITASRLQPSARRPMPGGDVQFQVALLITEVISDIRGIRGHERYVGLYSFETGTLKRVHPGSSASALVPATRRLRARLVEFQLVHWTSPETNVKWEDLFPDQPDLTGEDIRARIVSVSPPVEVTMQ